MPAPNREFLSIGLVFGTLSGDKRVFGGKEQREGARVHWSVAESPEGWQGTGTLSADNPGRPATEGFG